MPAGVSPYLEEVLVEKDGSTIQYYSRSQAKRSTIIHEDEDEQLMRAQISHGPVKGDDVSMRKSVHATERNFAIESEVSGVRGEISGRRAKEEIELECADEEASFNDPNPIAQSIPMNMKVILDNGGMTRNMTQVQIPSYENLKEADGKEKQPAAFGNIPEK